MRAISRSALISMGMAAGLLLAPHFGVAQGRGAFVGLAGSWTGNGRVEFEGDKSENVKCIAYYKDRDGGAGVGFALRCSSATGGGIEIRANLAAAGTVLTGTWEERKYNTAGELKGTATGTPTGSALKFEVDGGGLSGTMTLTTSGAKQQVAFVSQGWALRGVNIALSKD